MLRKIDERYGRFSDFGLVGGLMVAVFLVGLVAREVAIDSKLLTMVVKIVICVLLTALLIPLVVCVRINEAPLPWMAPRTLRERATAGIIISILGASLGVVFIMN